MFSGKPDRFVLLAVTTSVLLTCVIRCQAVLYYDDAMSELTSRQQKELKVLADFIALACRSRHGREQTVPMSPELAGITRKPLALCSDCAELLSYASGRLRACPLEPKPSCKKCPVHCYRPEYRQKIRTVMAWSGKRLILRGRLDLLRHYFF